MLTPPDDLSDADVAAGLRFGWDLVADSLDYAPVGFGSHHWLAVTGRARWFVTVDDLETKRRDGSDPLAAAGRRLAAALAAARSLYDGGLEFVVAPIPTAAGDLLVPLDHHHVMALYPHVDGRTHEWGRYQGREHLLAIVDRLVEVHRDRPAIDSAPPVDDFSIPRRAELAAALTGPAAAGSAAIGSAGPYSAGSAQLLQRHASSVESALGRYDRLVAEVASRPDRQVVTHGEPHSANTITTDDGVSLVDWDTALLAPPERDLWMLLDEDASIADHYTGRTGTDVDLAAIELYRLRWDLTDIALYSELLRRPHEETEDVRLSWRELNRYLDPGRWTGSE